MISQSQKQHSRCSIKPETNRTRGLRYTAQPSMCCPLQRSHQVCRPDAYHAQLQEKKEKKHKRHKQSPEPEAAPRSASMSLSTERFMRVLLPETCCSHSLWLQTHREPLSIAFTWSHNNVLGRMQTQLLSMFPVLQMTGGGETLTL